MTHTSDAAPTPETPLDPAAADTSAADLAPADAAQRELAELHDRHVRLAAEFDNYRKRVAKERLELEERAQARLLGKLLDALDDLDRVAASDPATTPLETVRGAVDTVHKKLWKEFGTAGVERIDPAGAAFDPALHEAVSIVPAPSPAQERTVAATFQVGYAMKGHLVRPARVQVFSSEGLA
jgi:molecular chaperone GrpE